VNGQPRQRIFTRDEIEALGERYRAGARFRDLQRQFHADHRTLRILLVSSGVAIRRQGDNGKAKRGVKRAPQRTPLQCIRCYILLAEAPAGSDGVCGWCERESRGIFYRLPAGATWATVAYDKDLSVLRRLPQYIEIGL
jgi:hypothetical protein